MTLSERIREVLEQSPKPLSIEGIWMALGAWGNKQKIRAAVGGLRMHNIIVSSWKGGRCYYEPAEKSASRQKTHSGSGVIAGRITIGRGARWGAGIV